MHIYGSTYGEIVTNLGLHKFDRAPKWGVVLEARGHRVKFLMDNKVVRMWWRRLSTTTAKTPSNTKICQWIKAIGCNSTCSSLTLWFLLWLEAQETLMAVSIVHYLKRSGALEALLVTVFPSWLLWRTCETWPISFLISFAF